MQKFLTRLAPVAGLFALTATPANAEPVQNSWASITLLSGGWNEAIMRAELTGPFYNPHSCPMTDGYIVEATLPGAQLLESMLITAYARGDQVRLTIDGCAFQRPRVVGVDIRRAI